MNNLKPWQLFILIFPPILLVITLIILASWQLHTWGLNWLWGIVIALGVLWRFLLARWSRPTVAAIPSPPVPPVPPDTISEADIQNILTKVLNASQNDLPIWEDWLTFWLRCQTLVNDIAHLYYPNQKYPLLSISVMQIYGLVRGTVDDLDRWLGQLSPLLNSLTVSQLYEVYERYQQWSPWIRRALWVSNWAAWIINPVAAVANVATRRYSTEANQQLLANFAHLLREAALKTLCQQAVMLYSKTDPVDLTVYAAPPALQAQYHTLQEILTTAKVPESDPLQIVVVGRTGAGKSSLINGLFLEPIAPVDALPSTKDLQQYQWDLDLDQESLQALTLWDTPGYEDITQPQQREAVLTCARQGDMVLLVTPALDPALHMDLAFLQDLHQQAPEVPMITLVSQVDRLRPVREWQPPYHWETGDRPKEVNIRDAVHYRAESLGHLSQLILPIATGGNGERQDWGLDDVALALVERITPVQQLKLARFLKYQESRTFAAAQIIDRYSTQMATVQGLTALLKGPTLQVIARLLNGNPQWGMVLAEQVPVEQLPALVGKLQMAYELLTLFQSSPNGLNVASRLLQIWPLLLKSPATNDSQSLQRQVVALGRALVNYSINDLSVEDLSQEIP